VKRFLKILLAVLVFFLVALLGLTIYVKVKYPSERLGQLLISYLAQEYGLRVAITRLDFNLFSGFTLDGVAILGATADSAATLENAPLTIEKIKFAYRWRSLLSRQLDIDEITIARPAFFYRLHPDSSSNLDPILAAFADSTTAPNDTSAAGLPISIHLNALHLDDLRLKAALVSQVDSQYAALSGINLSVNDIEVDRQAHYRGNAKLSAASADGRYAKTPMGPGDSLIVAMKLAANLTSVFHGDSLAVQGNLALERSQIGLSRGNNFSLPRLETAADIRYNLASARLEIPEVRLLIDDNEQLAAQATMNQQNGASTFALRVNRGAVDLAQLLRLAREHASDELRAFLQEMDCAGELEFSGSEFNRNAEGASYRLVLRGRDLAYTDFDSKLKFTGGNLEADWSANADSSIEMAGKIHCATFDLPIDTAQVLKTGPVDLQIDLALTKDFLPRRGALALRWQNFAEGKIAARAVIEPSNVATRNGPWLSRLSGRAEISADSIEISALAANAAGKISGNIALAGKRFDEADLNFNWRNAKIRYETIEYKGALPAYHASAAAKLFINPALTQFSLSQGRLQLEPLQANFNATYDAQADTFRLNLPELAADLAQVRGALPDTILASMNYAKIKGHSTGNGWLRGRFLEPDSLDYTGIFALQSEDAAYADSALGIYTDSLQIMSAWILTAATTTGKYSVACSTPKLPDYFRQHLPPTKAAGKLTVEETTFTIDEGKFEIPDWHLAGNYRVDGEFRPAGTQVKTTVDLGIHAPQPFYLDRSTSLRGDLAAQFVIDQYIPDALMAPQPSSLSGWLRIDGLDAKIDTTLAVQNIKADCRFRQNFDMLYLAPDSTMTGGMKLEPENDLQPYLVLKPSNVNSHLSFNNAGAALLLYDLFRDAMPNHNGERSWLTIDEINVFGYRLSNLAADLYLGNCRLDVPRWRMNLFDGNLVGNFLIGLGNGNPDSISYATNMQISAIDVSQFRRLGAQLGGKKSRISANFALSGLGTPQGGEKLEEVANNLAGRLNITTIENKVASNLLQALDPNGTDKGIQNIRLLMKTRWNVRQLTFEMKSGFVYASLAHVKPWYVPFRLPQPYDFARFPVAPYLKTDASE
jgi:hypothetical protein